MSCATEADDWIRRAVDGEADSYRASHRHDIVGRRLGPYRICELIGEGGMGAVYVAERDDAQFVRRVAIKILPRAIESPEAIARFRDERQFLAALDHRNIVRLIDGGSTDAGVPYLVMERIEGKPITAYAREHALSIPARVRLLRDICAAVQYAHQNLIIHRDIKPANILVDASGVPKLLDFGIAKLLSPTSGFEREAKTRTGFLLFTPEYASPEQARGEAVSTATDVYSLGAVLYELVTDRPPHPNTGSVFDMLRVICEVDPVKPSLAAPGDRRRRIAGDLDNIILKALHKEPARRYATVEHLDEELGRFLDGLPVDARDGTFGYRAQKFVRRHKGAVIAAGVVGLTLVAATVVSLRQAQRADDAAAEARSETARARTAEAKILTQLDEIKQEQDRRVRAEGDAREKTNEAQMSREQLRVALEQTRTALEQARRDNSVAEQESRRAREAERRAEDAVKLEKQTRVQAEVLYQREKAHGEQLERQLKKITTELP